MFTALWLAFSFLASFDVTFDETLSTGPFVVLDQDADGALDVIILGEKRLFVLRKNGTEKAEVVWPAIEAKRTAFAKSAAESGVTACDLDGDRADDFLFSSPDGRVFAVGSKSLKVLAGYPVALPEAPMLPLVCGDWDKNGKPEWFAAVKAQTFGFAANGAPLPGMSVLHPKPIVGLTLGAFNNETSVALVAADESGELSVQRAGTAKEKLFQSFGFRLTAAPLLADIDDDGSASLIGLGEDYNIAVRQASPAAGFPVSTGYRFYAPPALGDVDGDGAIDIVAANADGRLYAVNGKGKSLPGFPAALGPRFAQSPWLFDRDLDGKLDIALLAPSGQVLTRTFDGKAGPELTEPFNDAGKAPAQLVATDASFCVYVAGARKLSMKEAPRAVRGLVDQAVIYGSAFANAGRTSRFAPNEARFKDVTVSPLKPKTDDVLTATYKYFDLDGDAEGATEIRWFRNQQHVPALDNQKTVPAAATTKKDTFHFTLQDAGNLKRFGRESPLTRIFKSAAVTIVNTAPTQPVVMVSPDAPRTDDVLSVSLTQPSVDADGDAIQYLYRWFKNRELQKLPITQSKVEPGLTKKGERWSVLVVATDGEGESLAADAERIVLNTLPLAPEVRFEPAAFDITTELKTVIAKPSSDADGDAVSYRYTWKVAGQKINQKRSLALLPPHVVRKNQDVELTVTPFDGEAEGASTTIQGKSRNAAPRGLALHLQPTVLRKADVLTGHLQSPALDPDADHVKYSTQWLLNDQPYPAVQGWSIPSAALLKGQQWTLLVTPSDDQEPGAIAKATIKVVNTVPRGLQAKLTDTRPLVTGKVAVEVLAPGVDDDGEPITVEFEWRKNGLVQTAFPKNKAALLPADLKKGDVWSVIAQSRDAESAGDKVSLGFAVRNTPPTAPVLRVEPPQPRSEQPVFVRLATPSQDDDRDKLTYRYRWFVDGSKMPWPETKDQLGANEVKKHSLVTVEVVAFDGEQESAPADASLKMANTLPTAPVVQLIGKSVEQPLECKTTKASTDVDGDKLTQLYEWTLDGVVQPHHGPTIDTTGIRRGHKWGCRAYAHDGEGGSPWSALSLLAVDNAPPAPPVVAIETSGGGPATVQDDLTCVVQQPSRDADGDAVSYRYAWKKKGVAEAWAEPRIDSKRLKRGDVWTCVVVAKDASSESKPAQAEVSVVNAVPIPPQVVLTPTRPQANEQLSCDIKTLASDPDGDKLSYRFLWFKDGVEQRFAATTSTVPGRLVRAGETWWCEVVASDGTADAPTAKGEKTLVQ